MVRPWPGPTQAPAARAGSLRPMAHPGARQRHLRDRLLRRRRLDVLERRSPGGSAFRVPAACARCRARWYLPVSTYWYPAKRQTYRGVGLVDVDEVRFPVDPFHLLVLRRRYPENRTITSGDRVRAVNQQAANRCYRLVIAQPGEASALAELQLLPRSLALRFNIGPLIRENPDGTTWEDGEVIHLYVEHADD